jgi:hypothetical protein
VPPPDGVIIKIQELRYLRATLAIVQKQDRIRPPCDAMIFALTANTGHKLKALRGRKKVGTDHAVS